MEKTIRKILNEYINESQKREDLWLINHDRPSLNFDKKFGTKLSQKYKFPFDLDGDVVEGIIKKCFRLRGGREISKEPKIPACGTMNEILDRLDEKYIDIPGLGKMQREDKVNVLFGMSSQFNMHDIIWYSINHHYAYNNPIRNEFESLPTNIYNSIFWVISPYTLGLIKSHFNID